MYIHIKGKRINFTNVKYYNGYGSDLWIIFNGDDEPYKIPFYTPCKLEEFIVRLDDILDLVTALKCFD